MATRSSVRVFSDPAVVSYYDQRRELHESERVLFETYLRRGMTILDMGVGAGRTTPYLSGLAGQYVGIDYSPAMITRCREKFPALSFLEMNASQMSTFPDASFDGIVFSCNGIDCLSCDAERQKCLRECARILRPGGVFIFSSHNARYLIFTPVLGGVTLTKKAWRVVYAFAHTLRNLPARLTSGAFWRGMGHVVDPLTHGGLVIYVSTPDEVVKEVRRVGLTVVRTVSANYPHAQPACATPWYYFACIKSHSLGALAND